jgi:hypothetical protein
MSVKFTVLLHEEVGGAVDVEVGGHVRDFGAVK